MLNIFMSKDQKESLDKNINRILEIMSFAKTLAGKSKTEMIASLRTELKINIEETTEIEGYIWPDSTNHDIGISLSLDYKNANRVDQIVITGFGQISSLMICANGLNELSPSRVNYSLDILSGLGRNVPKLTKITADALKKHPLIEATEFMGVTMLEMK